MKTIYIHKTCQVPNGLTYKGELLWSSFTRYYFVCGKLLKTGKKYRRVSKCKGGGKNYE